MGLTLIVLDCISNRALTRVHCRNVATLLKKKADNVSSSTLFLEHMAMTALAAAAGAGTVR